jgi:hypothetical protein
MSDESKPSGDEVFCVKCGEKVTVKDTLDSAGLSPAAKYLAECGHTSRCGWAFGRTVEEALAVYSENQKWGMDKIGELEDRLIGAEETIGELLQVEKEFEAYKRLKMIRESQKWDKICKDLEARLIRADEDSQLTEEESKELEALKLYSEKMKANDKSQWGKSVHIPLSLDTSK